MNTIHKIGAIVIVDDKFLVVRKKGKDIWTSLGGKPEKGETEEQTLVRETKEELNCGILIQKKLMNVEDKAVFDDAQVKLSFYLAELEGRPEVIDNELEEFAFIGNDYKQKGIKLPPSLENQVIPFCIKEGYLNWKLA
jgi:8-oxo-dGTP pyrophosphatase MutT (NUDIX family)